MAVSAGPDGGNGRIVAEAAERAGLI